MHNNTVCTMYLLVSMSRKEPHVPNCFAPLDCLISTGIARRPKYTYHHVLLNTYQLVIPSLQKRATNTQKNKNKNRNEEAINISVMGGGNISE